MRRDGRRELKKKFPGIPLFLVPRVVQAEVRRKRSKLSRIHVVRGKGNRFTVAIVWLPKKHPPDEDGESAADV